MSITARHKRPGAFKKLVQSLETTPTDRREKIIKALAAEDPELASHATRSLFKFEEFGTIDGPMLCEVMNAMKNEIRTLAMALSTCDRGLVERFVANMLPNQRVEFTSLAGEYDDITPTERSAARFRLIAKAREVENQGKFMLKKYSGPYPGNL